MGGIGIEFSKEIECPRVVFDSKLRWNLQIDSVKKVKKFLMGGSTEVGPLKATISWI
jgi:hypothetical protein